MTYTEALRHIHLLERFGSRPGLERVSELLALLGSPEKKLRCIHVAGTNGKGSTCTMLSEIFRAAGYKTGLTISPYVLDFRERIQINGEMISKQMLADATERVKKAADAMNDGPTEFEFITALAFDYFYRSGCEIVILETGLGGRFDATNVVEKPLASVIASISLDHMSILGDTIEKITVEKCGIVKPDGVTVCYPDQNPLALPIIRATADERNNRFVLPQMDDLTVLSLDITGSRFVYGGLELFVPMAGRHQIFNAMTAVEAVRAADSQGVRVPDESIVAGIGNTRFAARLEVLCREPLMLLDGAHNADGARVLANALRASLKGEKLTVIMGMLTDKAYREEVAELAPLSKAIITVRPENPRAMSAAALAKIASRSCEDVTAASSYSAALRLALQKSGGGPILICGSLYLASAIRTKALKFAESLQNNS